MIWGLEIHCLVIVQEESVAQSKLAVGGSHELLILVFEQIQSSDVPDQALALGVDCCALVDHRK